MMANWAFIENNQVKESYDTLPDNWRNISNFFALKDDVVYLRSLNWLPVNQATYDYDPRKQKLDNRRFVFDGTTVTEEYDIVDVPEAPQPTSNDIEKILAENIQNRLDDFARTRKYDDILSACSYANDANQRFQTEGSYCLQVRSATWQKFLDIMTDVKSGVRTMPMSYEDIVNELPELVWPA